MKEGAKWVQNGAVWVQTDMIWVQTNVVWCESAYIHILKEVIMATKRIDKDNYNRVNSIYCIERIKNSNYFVVLNRQYQLQIKH